LVYSSDGENFNARIIWPNHDGKKYLADNNGKRLKFSTCIDILNYMSKRGWEVVPKIQGDVQLLMGMTSNYGLLLKKYVTNDEEAKEGLVFDSDF